MIEHPLPSAPAAFTLSATASLRMASSVGWDPRDCFAASSPAARKTDCGIRYIEAAREDIATADRLIEELMRQSPDEVPAPTRRLLGLIEEIVKGQRIARSEFRFSRRDVRTHTEWGHTQLRIHLQWLEEFNT